MFLGNFAVQHPQAAQIHAAAQALGVKVGVFGEAANSVGGYLGLPAGGNVNEILKKRTFVLSTSSPSSTAPTRSPRAGRSTPPTSSSA